MKYFYLTLIILLAGNEILGQTVIPFGLDRSTIQCELTMENANTRVLRKKLDKNSGKIENSDFQVTYNNFPSEAIPAFEAALSIWSSYLITNIPINVDASWEPKESQTFGSAVFGGISYGFEGAKNNLFYPISLAEKMTGKELNDSNEPDIWVSINSDINWYYGIDGNPSANQADLVTVILHEIGHGLGFVDSFGAASNQGYFAQSYGLPFIYDDFVHNLNGTKLISDITNNSDEMYVELTGQNLQFQSQLALNSNGGINFPKLYAPSTFNSGSSIAHLDENTYPSGSTNSLMSPQLDLNEVIHNIGPVTEAILASMGWLHVKINHIPIKIWENTATNPIIEVNVENDLPIDMNKFFLYFSLDTFKTVYSTNFTDIGNNRYQAEIPVSGTGTLQYLIRVHDTSGRYFDHPSAFPYEFHTLEIGSDNTPPIIDHIVRDHFLPHENDLQFHTIIEDQSRINYVNLNYSVNGEPFATVPMQLSERRDNYYFASLDINALGLKNGIPFSYYLTTEDKSNAQWQSRYPETGSQSITMTSFGEPTSLYNTSFNSVPDDFYFYGMTTEGNGGLQTPNLHTMHPYQQGADEYYKSYFYAMLKTPIIIDASSPLITFDEMVFVEPGEDNSVFGSDQFYDYVVVEGSKDSGKTWYTLLDGYDAREYSTWFASYNSSLTDDISDYIPTENDYKPRVINMLNNNHFAAGDEILVRFKLFSDQLATGWGWAIDNLAIQTEITGLEEITNFSLYPNPANDQLVVEFDFSETSSKLLNASVADLLGRKTTLQQLYSESNKSVLDVSILKQGYYILFLQWENKVKTVKFLKTTNH